MAEPFVENLYALFRSMAGLPGGELVESPAGSRHRAFPANPMFNGTWGTRLAPEDVEAAASETEAWFASRGAEALFWWVDPDTRPTDLGDRVQARGWIPWELDAPGMAARIDDLDLSAVGKVGGDYRQGRVEDAAGLEDFARAFVAGFEVPGWAARSWVDATLAFGVADAPWQCYVGYLDGRPVATNMLFRGAGVASVFGVGVDPAVRGRGIGAAITLEAFADARDEGETDAVLFATELGAPVYRRIGFRDVGASMARYLWRGTADLAEVDVS